jgi:hypothetical protein
VGIRTDSSRLPFDRGSGEGSSEPERIRMKTLSESLEESDALRKTKIPFGMVRIERNDYSYGQQGQVTRTFHDMRDVLEDLAIRWIAYGTSIVTWPDGTMESFDMRVSPVCHDNHLGYGSIVRRGIGKITGTISRLPGVFVEYYGIRTITLEERKSFVMIHDTWGSPKSEQATTNQG